MLYKFLRFIANILFSPLFLLHVEGFENIPKDDGYIICANHKSNWDPIFLAVTFKKPIHFMAKKELFEKPVLKNLLNAIKVFPVDRKGRDLKSLKYSISLIKEGENIGIMPEGTRTKTIDRKNMKDGLAYVALKSEADILPVEIISSFIPFKKTYIYINEPIKVEDYKDLKSREAMKIMTDEVFKGIYKRQLQ